MWRALIVDDSALVREMIQAALEGFGFEFGHAADGLAAVAAVKADPWDLIFLDIMMPHLDGPAALTEIRGSGISTPVVLISTRSTARVLAPVVGLGGVNFLAKPFTADQARTYAAKALKQDPGVLARPPRVLLQHADPAVEQALRRLLPRHVLLETSHALAPSLDIAERCRADGHDIDLVILESRELADEMEAIAGVMRRAIPGAGIFAIADDTTADHLWQPRDAIDGRLPRELEAEVVRNFLYALFLRPLVLRSGLSARVSGFRGPPALRDAYLARVTRMLLTHIASNPETAEVVVDVTMAPGGLDGVVALVATLEAAVRATGAAATFRTAPQLRAAAAERLPRVVIIG